MTLNLSAELETALQQAKEAVLFWSQKAFEQQLFAGTSGNLSARVQGKDWVVITPSGIRYETMTTEDLMVIDLADRVISGKHLPSTERLLHLEAYRASDKIAAVVHTHSPYATAFAAGERDIPLLLTEMIPPLKGPVPCLPVRLPGSPELAKEAAESLAKQPVCLIGHHGAVAVGSNLAEAYVRAEYIEDAARICTYAQMQGGYRLVPDEIVAEIKRMYP